jgi:GAF domain-containing protein
MSLHPDSELTNLAELLTLPDGEAASVEQRLARIVSAATRLFSPSCASLVPFNPETRVALPTVQWVAAQNAASPAPPRNEELARRISATGTVFLADLAHHPTYHEPFANAAGIGASAALTLTARPSGAPLGVLYLDYADPRSFSAAEQAALRFFADQAALALQQTWLLHRYAEVTRLGQAINSELTTVERLFAKLRSGIADLLDCNYFFMLAIYQREHEALDLYCAEQGLTHILKDEPLEGACAWVIANQQPLLIRHFSAQEPALPVAPIQIPGTDTREESLIYVPLIFRDRALGVLSVQHPEPGFYDAEDLQVLQLLGNQVALALNTIRLFDGLEQLNATGQALVGELDLGLEAVAHRVAELVRATTQADLVNLYTTDAAGQLSPGPILAGHLFVPDHPRVNPPRQDDTALLALNQLKPTYARDSTTLFTRLGGDPTLRRGAFIQREQIKSTAAVALRIGEAVAGVLFINFRQAQRFDAFQRQLIESLASYAAIALRNAGQYDAMIRRRIDELEALQQVDHELSTTLNLQATLETIVRFAREHTQADEASVVLLNESIGMLECAAAVGINAEERRAWRADPATAQSIITWAFTQCKTARVGDVHQEEPWRAIYNEIDPRVTSEMDVPLKTPEGAALGVINLECFRAHAFGPDEQRFIETLAGQAVLALKNAQAYEREQRMAAEQAAMLEIGKEIVRQLQPNEVFARIFAQAMNLTGASVGTLHLYDEQSGMLQMVYQQGVSEEHLLSAAEMRLGEGVLGTAARERAIIRVDDAKDPRWKDIHLQYIPDARSELVVPLIDGDRLRGVLNVESATPHHFTERDERLLAAFADLVVIALQNAEHYAEAQSQRQRAVHEERRFRLLYGAGQRLTAVTDERAAFTVVADIAHNHYACRVVGRRFDPAGERLLPLVEIGNRPDFRAFPMLIGEGVNGQVARERRTIVVHDLLRERADQAPTRSADPLTRSMVVTPIEFEQIYYGNLALSHTDVAYFQHADVDLVKGLAQQLGITLHRLEATRASQEAQQRVREAEAMTAIGHAAYELAHRLGNDLGPIIPSINRIRSELSRLGVQNEAIERNLEQIANDKRQAVGLITRLKEDLAKQDLGGDGPGAREQRAAAALLVRELLEETARSYALLPATIRVGIECDTTVGLVWADYRQVTDILRNLFTNAVEALPTGGTIMLRARNDGQCVLIDVLDSGPGITEARLGRIFDLFYSTKPGGTGFGLWSARRNALANGGELTVQSTPGAGTIFTLSLPRAATLTEEPG